MSGLSGTMPNGGGASKRLAMGIAHVPKSLESCPDDSKAKRRGDSGPEKLTIKAVCESDSGLFSN